MEGIGGYPAITVLILLTLKPVNAFDLFCNTNIKLIRRWFSWVDGINDSQALK